MPLMLYLALATAAQDGQVPVKTKRERKICRSDFAEATGSNMPSTTCHTKAEWDQIKAGTLVEPEKAKSGITDYRGTAMQLTPSAPPR